jgi:hypothetical protein
LVDLVELAPELCAQLGFGVGRGHNGRVRSGR